MKVRQEPLGNIAPYPNNPRVGHDISAIAASIRAFGFRVPIVVDHAGVIIAGHGRYYAAKELGLDKVPVHRLADGELTPQQVVAYRLADNKAAESSEWQEAQLLAELQLLDERARLEAGFAEAYVAELERRVELEQLAVDPSEDEVPELPAQPVSRLGDLWVLGEHRLLCGDATVVEDVARLGDHGHLMVTDPPYGVNYDPNWRDVSIASFAPRVVSHFENDDIVDWSGAWALFKGDVVYIWHAGLETGIIAASLALTGLEVRTQIIWAKQHFVIGRGHYHVQHEPCWYAVRRGKTGHWTGDRTQSTLWAVTSLSPLGGGGRGEDKNAGHSTQKPVEVMRRPMLNNSRKGDLVYDPFVGSGTTIIAAETVGRRARCIELEPAYVDMSVERWQRFTGKKAVLDGTGQTFDEVRDLRANVPLAAAVG